MSALYSSSVSRRSLLDERARTMRAHATLSERLLWSALRGGRLGVAFRRQQVIEPFIVDFLAKKARLIVEIDGDLYHARRRSADAARERKLVRAGYTVLRIPASVVESDLARRSGSCGRRSMRRFSRGPLARLVLGGPVGPFLTLGVELRAAPQLLLGWVFRERGVASVRTRVRVHC